MRTAYHAASALDAEAQLLTLARELHKTHPGAAASLREGLTCAIGVASAVDGLLGRPPKLVTWSVLGLHGIGTPGPRRA
jgi:putative transposase